MRGSFLLLISVAAVGIAACSSPDSNLNEQSKTSLEGDVLESLWTGCCAKSVDIKISSQTDESVSLDIFVHAPSLIDKGSRDMMLSLFIYDLLHEKALREIRIKYVDEGFEHEPINVEYDQEKIAQILKSYENNPTFLDYARYTVKEFTSQEVITCNTIIPQIHNLLGDKFPFEGDYWALLYDYSTEPTKAHPFNIFVELASLDTVGVTKGRFDYYLNHK